MPSSWKTVSNRTSVHCEPTYLIIRLVILIPIAHVILILIILIFKLALIEVLQVFVLESLTSEPVDSTGNELLLDVLTQLIVKLQALLNVRRSIVIILRGLRRVEEVEE